MRAKLGTLGTYKRRCYGYRKDKNGDLQINKTEAAIVRDIFDMYLNGDCFDKIIKRLHQDGIKTADGKEKWSKSAIDRFLSNEKYCGDVVLFKEFSQIKYMAVKTRKMVKNRGEHAKCLITENHPAVISKEMFEAVQIAKEKRSRK